jgi:hypothetical protein
LRRLGTKRKASGTEVDPQRRREQTTGTKKGEHPRAQTDESEKEKLALLRKEKRLLKQSADKDRQLKTLAQEVEKLKSEKTALLKEKKDTKKKQKQEKEKQEKEKQRRLRKGESGDDGDGDDDDGR